MNAYGVIYQPNGFIISTILEPHAFDVSEVFDGMHKMLVESEGKIHPDTHCVKDGGVALLSVFPPVGVSVTGSYSITLTGLPPGSTVIWPDGVSSQEDDGTLQCDVVYPGEYVFKLQHPYHTDKDIVADVLP